ncbi:hypothetical protein [Variovorax sp. UMC13]|uniref:hypothetical protein n=1 Tax=Variovorax sp. UMC13 TaxID=1862326 RepID=UPI00160373CE|nr:hypothetical protein [Variovorax sp. UMC13]
MWHLERVLARIARCPLRRASTSWRLLRDSRPLWCARGDADIVRKPVGHSDVHETRFGLDLAERKGALGIDLQEA